MDGSRLRRVLEPSPGSSGEKEQMAEERFDAIVVGAGFGGSARAGLLARRGLVGHGRLLLVEDQVG
jgi:cation diffusion facilitator CzcD-associated flavoprotein CzcO